MDTNGVMTVVYCISFFSVAIAIVFAVYLHLWVNGSR